VILGITFFFSYYALKEKRVWVADIPYNFDLAEDLNYEIEDLLRYKRIRYEKGGRLKFFKYAGDPSTSFDIMPQRGKKFTLSTTMWVTPGRLQPSGIYIKPKKGSRLELGPVMSSNLGYVKSIAEEMAYILEDMEYWRYHDMSGDEIAREVEYMKKTGR